MPSRLLPWFRAACSAATFAVAAVILYESMQERGRPGVPDVSTTEAYVGHFAVYGLLTFCALVAFAPRSLPALAAVVALATGFGVALEVYQMHLSTRTASAGDAIADGMGAVCGLAVFLLVSAWLASPRKGPPTRA